VILKVPKGDIKPLKKVPKGDIKPLKKVPKGDIKPPTIYIKKSY
jgi:hypothetical protein